MMKLVWKEMVDWVLLGGLGGEEPSDVTPFLIQNHLLQIIYSY